MKNKITLLLRALATAIVCVCMTNTYGQVTIYDQDFEGAYPWGMTINSLIGGPMVWESGDDVGASTDPGGSGDYATANSDNYCDEEWDTELRTPVIDLTQYIDVELSFKSYFNDFIGIPIISVEVSTNGGSSWTTVYTESNYVEEVTTIDLSDYDGNSNVLIRWRYQDSFGCSYWWSIDDIEVSGTIAPPCTSPPNAGTAVSAAPAVCTGGLANLSLTGNTIGLNQTYQWQVSTDSFVWTDISGATNSSTSQVVTGTTYFRNILTCSGLSDTSTAATVTTSFMFCYCTPIHNDGFGNTDCGEDYTSNVKFGTINNSSGCSGSAAPYNYSDYTAISTTVLKGNSYPISVTIGGDTDGIGVWIDFDHSGTFDASEFVLHGYSGNVPATYTGNVLIPTTALTGPTVMRVRNRYDSDVSGGSACATFDYGEVEHYTIDIIGAPTDEAGVVEITRPAIAACTLGDQLWVNLQNLGSNDLTTATFTVKVNNLPVTVNNPWTGLVPAGATQEVQVPLSYPFADGDSISVTVTDPNGIAENALFTFNNHFGRRAYAGLSGDKTVYGVGADFSDINAAVQALVSRGVCDTVYFKIAANTYTTQHTFLPYTAAGPGKLAVFESATGNANDVIFNFAGGSSTNYVFRFDGASYYSLRNITAKAAGTTYAGVIDFTDNAHNIELADNIFISDTSAAYSTNNFNKTVVSSDFENGDDYDNIWIHDNQIIGGCRSFDLEVDDGEYQSFVIENNQLSKFSVLGILTYNTAGLEFNNNTVEPRSGVNGEMYGVYVIQGVDGGSISGNKITIPGAGMGVLLLDAVGGASPILVSNNFIYTGDTTTTATSAGISVTPDFYGVNGILLANNSISFRSKNGNMGAINIDGGTSISMVNNNIGSFNSAPALRISSANSIGQSTNNNIFGALLATIDGDSYTTLAALQSAGYGANSVSVNPGFTGMDLHTCAIALNGTGMPLPSITDDFDGDLRGTTPDIGADEFVGDANNLLVEDAFLKCPTDQVTIGNTAVSGVTYSWSPSGSSSEITATAAGDYIVTATSSCGSYSDTAVVVNKPLPDAAFTAASVGLTGIFNNTSTNSTDYSWDFGDTHTSTDMNPSHVYSSAGTYSVTLTVTNDCGTDSFGPVAVNVINAGIEENDGLEVSLFPNPTSAQFTITMSAISSDATTIHVVDVTGKTVMIKNIAAGVNQVSLDATSFASGVYSVKIENGNYVKVLRLIRN